MLPVAVDIVTVLRSPKVTATSRSKDINWKDANPCKECPGKRTQVERLCWQFFLMKYVIVFLNDRIVVELLHQTCERFAMYYFAHMCKLQMYLEFEWSFFKGEKERKHFVWIEMEAVKVGCDADPSHLLQTWNSSKSDCLNNAAYFERI